MNMPPFPAAGHPALRLVCKSAVSASRHRLTSLSVAIVVVFAACAAFAEAPGERPPPGRSRLLAVPPAATSPKIDGTLDDEVWNNTAIANQFWIVEQERRPSEQTEVLVAADAEFIYMGFRVYDSQPDKIMALETRRDARPGLDDLVCVELDPYLSHREVSSYCINARGTVSDSIAGGRASQEAWKGTWEGAAQRTHYGWSAEMAIPFEILNFETGVTAFGANFIRYHNRTAEWSRWADTTVQYLPEERGRLTELSPARVAQRSPLTAMPYILLGKNIPDREGDIRNTLVNGGIDIRYQPKTNLTGVLSINPDFSQIEEAVTNIAFSYNEKYKVDNRPFFQEGGTYFGKEEYFYTNRVPDFDAGAKLFGRTSGVQYGFFATRSPDARTDTALQVTWEADARHSISGMFVGTDQPELKNGLLYASAQGREQLGLIYQIDAAATRTDPQPGDGSFLQGMVGWKFDFWTLNLTGSRYTLNYKPELGLLATDLLDTRGLLPGVSYYRDMGTGPIREVTSYALWNWREIGDGHLQRSSVSVGGTLELRNQIRLGLHYSAGPYRPLLDGTPGNWSDNVNHDRYLSGTIDFPTRNKFFQIGGSYAFGNQGGGDYEYISGYVTSRPTATTYFNVTAERVYSFGWNTQVVATTGWNVTPLHGLYARYIYNEGDYYRLAYTWRIRQNIDLFALYDKQPGADASISAKLLMSLPIPSPFTNAPQPKTQPLPQPENKMQDWWKSQSDREIDLPP
jgi:hypothetical protein